MDCFGLLVGTIIGLVVGIVIGGISYDSDTALKLSNVMNASMLDCVTQKIITNVLQIIAQKNYQGSVLFPDTYRLLSSATYKQMGEIVKVLNNRLDDAKVLDKNLSKEKNLDKGK